MNQDKDDSDKPFWGASKEGRFPIFLRGDASEDEIEAFAHEVWLRLQLVKADLKKEKIKAKRDRKK